MEGLFWEHTDVKGGIVLKRSGLSQEWLKLLACVSMLIDHVGLIFLPQFVWLRIIGRIAFPIYCFLLVEGVCHTKNPMKYALRLGICVVLSELPYDLAFYGQITMADQNVILTLFIGFWMAMSMKMTKNILVQMVLVVPFALLAQGLHTDYGGLGVVLIAVFFLTKGVSSALMLQLMSIPAVLYLMNTFPVEVAGMWIPIEMFALLALVPIGLYSGRKFTHSKLVQWGFYLFYPVHLTVLYLIWRFVL